MADERVPGTGPHPSEEPRETLQEWPAWLIQSALWGSSLLVVSRLPARVPRHWNLHGEVNRWGGPLEAALVNQALPRESTSSFWHWIGGGSTSRRLGA